MKKTIGILALSLAILSCSSDDENARLEIRLTDAPGDYEAVNVDIQGVEIHADAAGGSGGWKSLEVNKGIYNLLEFTNGLDTLLATAEVPAGRVSQVRLILGEDNSVKIDGKEIELTTPSAQQSGLKLNVHADLAEGITYKMLLDFDAARSIVKTGNDSYILKPVIRTIAEATSGAIKGTVSPVESYPAIFAIIGTDTLGSTYTDDAGNYFLKGLPAGSYKVTFDAKEGYTDFAKEGVNVTVGSVTDMGNVSLQ